MKNFNLFLVAMVLGLSSCFRNSDNINPVPIQASIDLREPDTNEKVLFSSTLFDGIQSVTYNSAGMPEELKLSVPSAIVHIGYSNDSVIFTSFSFEKIVGKVIYELKDTLVVKSTAFAVNNDKETKLGTWKYEYAFKKLRKKISTVNGVDKEYIEYFYDTSYENVISKEIHGSNGKLLQKTVFQYTNILDRSSFFNHWSPNMDGALFPQRSKYLVTNSTVENSGITTKSNFSYEFDDYGYVTKGKQISEGEFPAYMEWVNIWK